MTQTPVIFGEVLFDQFPDGSSVPGGAPFNVAWHLQAFGRSPLLISRIGEDKLGRRIQDAMKDWGMTTAGLQRDPDHPTGTVSVSLKEGEPSFEIVPNQAYDHISAAEFPDLSPSLIYHGSLAVRHPDSAAALEALLSRSPSPVFVDVNLRAPWWKAGAIVSLLEHARWVKLNAEEIDLLVEQSGPTVEKARYLIERQDLDMVILTFGAEGAACIEADGAVQRVHPRKVEVVDTVGAGDAFASVIILGLLNQWPTNIMIARAQAFASAVVSNRGATTHDQDFYLSFIQQWGRKSS